MVEVDPMILVAAGSVAASLAAALLCLRGSSKQTEKKSDSKKVEVVEKVKPKKKATKIVKKTTVPVFTEPRSESESEELEIAAIIASVGPVEVASHKVAKKAKDVKIVGPSASEIAATKAAAAKKAKYDARMAAEALQKVEDAEMVAREIAARLEEEEEAKKSKKAKETPDQRVARLERQRLAKVKKVEEEELSKVTAIQLAAVENRTVQAMFNTTSSIIQPVHVDGWAVVEDKKKVKKVVPPVKTVAVESAGAGESAAPVDSVRVEIVVESKKIGAIIGPKGVTLHGIQDATGVEINTPKGDRDNAAPVIITITGTADGVARASRAINDLCSKGYTKMLAGDDFKEGFIEVHPNCLSDIIGKKGLNIRAIQDFTGVKLAVPQVSRDHILPVKITVAGPKEKVQQAKDIILELITYFHTTVTHPGQVHVEMDVPVALYNYIIGSKGSEIKHIQANFKVAVHIPNADSRVKQVLIVGEPVGVKGAEKYIQKIIDQAMADREAAEKMADSWVEEEAVEENEEWMNEFTHPKNRHQDTDNTPSPIKMGGGLSTTGVEYPEGGLNVGAASSAAVAASASSWGANVLASAEGW